MYTGKEALHRCACAWAYAVRHCVHSEPTFGYFSQGPRSTTLPPKTAKSNKVDNAFKGKALWTDKS